MKDRFIMLIAHRDAAARAALAAVFDDAYDILHASTGAQALALMRAGKAEILVLDLDIAEPDGFAVMAGLKRDPVAKDIPVVVFTDRRDDDKHRRALLMGAEGFISADYDPVVVNILVRNLLTRYIRQILEPQRQLAYERMVNDCLKLIYGSELSETTVAELLSKSASFMGAERAYACKADDSCMVYALEWTAPGVPPQTQTLRCVPLETMALWEAVVGDAYYVYIEDREEIREAHPAIYARLAAQDIRSIAMMLIKVDGVLHALIGYDNPQMRGEEMRKFFDNVFFFINIAIDKAVRSYRLDKITYHDATTGLMNRAKFYKDIKGWEDTHAAPTGIVYLDLNSLKEINDSRGHEAGDEAIRQCAQTMLAHCPQGQHYRLGGDEFIILLPDTDAENLAHKVQAIRAAFGPQTGCKAAVGGSLWTPGQTLEKQIAAADQAMYQEKEAYYREQSHDRRRKRE